MTLLMTLNQHKKNYVIIAILRNETMGELVNLLISNLHVPYMAVVKWTGSI